MIKKLFSFILLAVTLSLSKSAQSQIHLDLGGGIETAQGHPIMKIAAGYTYSNIMVAGVMQPAITRASDAPHYFGLKAGYNVHNIIPGVGYYYNYVSADKPRLNHTAVGYSLKYIYEMGEPGGLYAEAMYIEKSFQITIGFHCKF